MGPEAGGTANEERGTAGTGTRTDKPWNAEPGTRNLERGECVMAFDSRQFADRRVMRLERRIARDQRRMLRHQLRMRRHQLRMLRYQQKLQRVSGCGAVAMPAM